MRSPQNYLLFFILVLIPPQDTCLLAQESVSLPALPSYAAVLSASLRQSLPTKRAILVRDRAVVARSLVGFAAFPQLGVSAALVERRPENNVAQPTTQTYSAQLNYNVLDFGRTRAQKRAADAQIDAANQGVEATNEDLSWEVARNYLALVTAVRLLDINRQNLTLSRNKFATVRANYQKGLRPENDLISAQADLGNVQLAFDRAEADLSVMRQQLESLTGDASLFRNGGNDKLSSDVVTKFLDRNPDVWQRLINSWSVSNLSAAQRQRSFERQALIASETAAASVYRPRLGLAMTAQQSGPSEKELEEQYSGQVQLSWDLPWPGALRDARRQVSLQRNILETEEAIELDARKKSEEVAKQKITWTARLWKAAEAQLSLRMRQYDLTRKRYEAGKASAFELSNSELELGNSRLERVRIANSFVAAVLDLAEARRISDPGVIFK